MSLRQGQPRVSVLWWCTFSGSSPAHHCSLGRGAHACCGLDLGPQTHFGRCGRRRHLKPLGATTNLLLLFTIQIIGFGDGGEGERMDGGAVPIQTGPSPVVGVQVGEVGSAVLECFKTLEGGDRSQRIVNGKGGRVAGVHYCHRRWQSRCWRLSVLGIQSLNWICSMCLKYQAQLEPKGRLLRLTTLAFTTTTFMGRYARYLTTDTKASARHQSDLLYSQSPQRLKQLRKVAQTPPTNSLNHIPGFPLLSLDLVALNKLPLPESNPLFQAALTAASWIDVSDLGRWKKQPPFEQDNDTTDPCSTSYLRYSANIAVVLHGDRMREQNERDVQRRAEFHGAGCKKALERLREEVVGLLSELSFFFISSYH
ncbi:hypothetical protein B0H14DRAFT_3715560 [Mycena olivaceomarginata]|nr:hypothetical protein B0H14DRAFT_3715560 [Mycena olivaceomarginata]